MPLDAAVVEMVFEQEGQVVENVFGVAVNTPLSVTDADAIRAAVSGWRTSTLKALQGNNVFYRVTRVKDANINGPSFEYAEDGAAGTAAANPLANGTTFSVKKNTGLAGRENRGRFFHIGLTTTHQDPSDPNMLTSAAVTALVNGYRGLVTVLATALYPLVIIQYDRSVHPPVAVRAIQVLTCSAADSVIDSQRRRLPRRGR